MYIVVFSGVQCCFQVYLIMYRNRLKKILVTMFKDPEVNRNEGERVKKAF